MIEQGASDLHISTGSPPQIRIDGKMTMLTSPNLSSAETKQLCYSVLTDAQKRRFEEENELDLSFGVKGLSRFRGNLFVQRGAVAGAFRAIPFDIKSFEDLGLPSVVRSLSKNRVGWFWSPVQQGVVNRQRSQQLLMRSIQSVANISSQSKIRLSICILTRNVWLISVRSG